MSSGFDAAVFESRVIAIVPRANNTRAADERFILLKFVIL